DPYANRPERPDSSAALAESRELMDEFARSTGLVSAQPPRRYLWTDAYAVCNYLGLREATGEEEYLELALRLVDQVHRTLGRHREDDAREGWISGLPEAEGEQHPTAGGLRIGKPLPERKPGEPYDRRMEWERDGQYFHYLTRWMHALRRVWRVTGDAEYHRWGVELGHAAIRGFARTDGGERRLHWKMSINLSRPLVPSTGQHDPLDGYLTVSLLRETAPEGRHDVLAPELHLLRKMVERERGSWATSDALGAGGLLVDAYRSLQLRAQDRPTALRGVTNLPEELIDESLRSVAAVAGSGFRRLSADRRLAFRELGLSIGLGAVERMAELTSARPMERYLPLRDEIHRFWLDPHHRRAETWTGHRDISRVMLATSLAPGGYLDL
ncbi:MAG: hypothetical protein ACLFWG_10015, partial [Longimicrobiales bacterium]